MPKLAIPLLLSILCVAPNASSAAPDIDIVAAESVYANVAGQIAGPGMRVTAILSNPAQDPHQFEASPSVARALSDATITIENGAFYDPWMSKLLSSSKSLNRHEIVLAKLLHARPGANPHLWYDPRAIRVLAAALTETLDADRPAGKAGFDARDAEFVASLAAIDRKIAEIRARFGGTKVTATEPVFGLMANALGLVMRNASFQIAVMNDVEPRASDVAAMQDDLRLHRVALLFYNLQTSDNSVQRLLEIAGRAHVPIVGVFETEPAGMDYQHWMLDTLDHVEAALSKARS